MGWGDTSQLLRENLDLRPGPGPCAARQAGDEREDIPARQPCGRAPRRGLPRLPCGTGVTAPQRKWGRDRVTRGSSGLPGDGTGVGLGPDEEPPRAAATSSCRSSSSRPRLRVRSWHPPIPPTAGPAGSQRQPPAGSVLPSQAAAVGRAPAGPAVGRAPVRGTPGPELQASLPCMSSATCTFHSRRAPGGPGLAEASAGGPGCPPCAASCGGRGPGGEPRADVSLPPLPSCGRDLGPVCFFARSHGPLSVSPTSPSRTADAGDGKPTPAGTSRRPLNEGIIGLALPRVLCPAPTHRGPRTGLTLQPPDPELARAAPPSASERAAPSTRTITTWPSRWSARPPGKVCLPQRPRALLSLDWPVHSTLPLRCPLAERQALQCPSLSARAQRGAKGQ